MRKSHVIALVLADGFSTARVPDARAQAIDDLFNDTVVQEIRLTLNSRSLSDMHANWKELLSHGRLSVAEYPRAQHRYPRARRFGSRNPDKLGLRIDFNRYTKGQEFLGVKSLVLDNHWQDGPSCTNSLPWRWARVSGIRHHASRSAGWTSTTSCRGSIRSSNPSTTNSCHERSARVTATCSPINRDPRTRPIPGSRPGALQGDVRTSKPREGSRYDSVRADSRSVRRDQLLNDGVWRQRVNEYLDLEQFMTQAAFEAFVAELDGINGVYGMNNFYLYRSVGSKRHRLFMWDKDSAFDGVEWDIFSNRDKYMLFERLLSFPDLRETYLRTLEDAARSAAETSEDADRSAGESWLEREITRIAALLASDVRQDPRERFSTEQFLEAVETMKDFARRRFAFVLEEVARARRGR